MPAAERPRGLSTCRSRVWLLVLAACVLPLALWPSQPAAAHDPGATLISVGVRGDGESVEVRALVPVLRYDVAYGTALAESPEDSVESRRAALEQQVLRAAEITSASSGAWAEELTSLGVTVIDGVAFIDVALTAIRPGTVTDASAEAELTWTLITESLSLHRVLVVSDDREEAALAADTVAAEDLIGVLTQPQPTVAIGGKNDTFGALLVTGFEHFREGPDHLLFLCLLALSALRRRDGVRLTAIRLAALTATFTLGHSVSLAIATLGVADLPGAWIESAIAASIVLAAWHATRPRLSLRPEIALTAAFGLIHGLGFAGTLADLSLTGLSAAVPLLGFNLGLELAQILGLLVVLAPVALIARSRIATYVVAGDIATVAALWIGDRALGLGDPLEPVVSTVAATPERLALVLAAVALPVLIHPFRTKSTTARVVATTRGNT